MMDFGVGLGAELRYDEVAEHTRVADEAGVSCVQYAVLNQKANMRAIADQIMPHFR